MRVSLAVDQGALLNGLSFSVYTWGLKQHLATLCYCESGAERNRNKCILFAWCILVSSREGIYAKGKAWFFCNEILQNNWCEVQHADGMNTVFCSTGQCPIAYHVLLMTGREELRAVNMEWWWEDGGLDGLGWSVFIVCVCWSHIVPCRNVWLLVN